MSANITPSWKKLGDPAPDSLTESRKQLHWAAQAVASVGHTLIKAVPDYNHTSLVWLEAQEVLAGQPANFPREFRAAIRPAGLVLMLIEPQGEPIAETPLKGRTLKQALEWLASAIGKYTGQALTAALETPGYELPPHPAGDGAPFGAAHKEALPELARWYANAAALLGDLVARTPGASPVRCWPHHFDIATVIELDAGVSGEDAPNVGVGMSPGDGSYPEPYWYVTPWPYPENPNLPDLPGGGRWNREDWVGAILTGSASTSGDAQAQAEQVTIFIDAAVAACRELGGG